jgi:predicted AlkP superfamily phosphohydrolase/phosphomutase
VNTKAAIIGLDGVPYDLIIDLANRDIMPYTGELLKEGKITKARTSLPPNSAVSWSSIFTARNPGEHGIYGFTDFLEDSYTVAYHHSMRLKAQPFWQKNHDKRTVIVNLPATYPPQALNGVHISGFVSPQLDRAIYPKEKAKLLEDSGYMVDVTAPFVESEIPTFLGELTNALEKRVTVGKKLLQDKWDIAFFVVTGTDRIGHYLWDAYRNKRNQYHDDFIAYFRKVDDAIHGITEELPEDTALMMLSDHGMTTSGTAFNLNTLLKEEGYLMVDDKPEINYNAVKKPTKAFASETNKIHLNLESRFPRGSVKSTERIELEDEIKDLLTSVRLGGRRVVKSVYTRDEIFDGPHSSMGPELVVLPEDGFSFKTGLFSKQLTSVDRLQGRHTEENAFLYLKDADNLDEFTHLESALLALRTQYGGLNL